MTTPDNKKPDPLAEQQEALNRALEAGAARSARSVEAADLDVFTARAVPLQPATSAGPADVTFGREREDTLNRPGEGEAGPASLSSDESVRANEAEERIREGRASGEGEEPLDFGESSESQSPLDVLAANRLRAASALDGGSPDESARSPIGSAAGQTRPESSEGAGGDAVSQGVGGASDSGVTTGGSGSASNATNPFTGQGMGVNAYGTPGIPGVGAPASAGGWSDPLVGIRLSGGGGSRGDSSPNVMDGGSGSSPLQAAYEYANSQAGQQETAKKHGVTPPGGGAGEEEPAPADEPDEGEQEEEGLVDSFVSWVKEQTSGDGGPSRYEQEIPTDVGIGGSTTTNAQGSKDVGIKNLETAMSDTLGGFVNTGKKPGVKDQVGPDGENDGPPTGEEIAFRSYLRQVTNYHGSPGINEGDSTPTDDANPAPTGFIPRSAGRDVAHSLFGQPNEDGPRMRAGGAPPSTLPGDVGNIDYGPDSTGAFTSDPVTEDESAALDGLGGSGLSIADARRDDEDEEEDDDGDA